MDPVQRKEVELEISFCEALLRFRFTIREQGWGERDGYFTKLGVLC